MNETQSTFSKRWISLLDMNETQLVGQSLVDFLMSRFNMTEDEALRNLAENLGNVKLKKLRKD